MPLRKSEKEATFYDLPSTKTFTYEFVKQFSFRHAVMSKGNVYRIVVTLVTVFLQVLYHIHTETRTYDRVCETSLPTLYVLAHRKVNDVKITIISIFFFSFPPLFLFPTVSTQVVDRTRNHAARTCSCKVKGDQMQPTIDIATALASA